MNVEYSEDQKVLIRATEVEGNFEIPETVESIDSFAFDGCESM